MEEKVLYINLPEGSSYRRVEVADGRIGIVYTEECANKKDFIKSTSTIPKPKPLIGGTKVYQKENGTPYWYCRIKDGRDEFMNVYFDDLTEKDLLYDATGKERKFEGYKREHFKTNVLNSLKCMPVEGYRWIPVFEPSIDSRGNLQYVEGECVLAKLDSYEWEKLFKQYSPRNGSHMAPITTYFLLALRWLKDGVATLEQLADDSTDIGNYRDKTNDKYILEFTGGREFGGLYGFVGNTRKIIKDFNSTYGFSYVGGDFTTDGIEKPLTYVQHIIYPNFERSTCVGLLELTK